MAVCMPFTAHAGADRLTSKGLLAPQKTRDHSLQPLFFQSQELPRPNTHPHTFAAKRNRRNCCGPAHIHTTSPPREREALLLLVLMNLTEETHSPNAGIHTPDSTMTFLRLPCPCPLTDTSRLLLVGPLRSCTTRDPPRSTFTVIALQKVVPAGCA